MIEAPWLNLHAGSEKPDRRACNQKHAPLNLKVRSDDPKKRRNTTVKLPGEIAALGGHGKGLGRRSRTWTATGATFTANEPDPDNSARAVRQTQLKLTYTENGKSDPETDPRGSVSVQSDRRRPPLSNPRRTAVEPP